MKQAFFDSIKWIYYSDSILFFFGIILMATNLKEFEMIRKIVGEKEMNTNNILSWKNV
jgi:hypothetical protein